jgi:hypothetical protein
VTGNFDSTTTAVLTSFADGLAVYAAGTAGVTGAFGTVNGEVVSLTQIDVHTGATINNTTTVPDGGSTLTLMGIGLGLLAIAKGKLLS